MVDNSMTDDDSVASSDIMMAAAPLIHEHTESKTHVHRG
jgi:hypothetical protein